MDTEVPLDGRVLTTPWIQDGRSLGLLGRLYVFPVGLGVPALGGLLAEAGEVAGRVLRASFSPCRSSISDWLRPSTTSQRVFDFGSWSGWPTSRYRSTRREASAHPDVVGRRSASPSLRQSGVDGSSGPGIGEPALGVGSGDDEVDGALAGLPVDVEAHRVVAVEDIAGREVVEFAGVEAGLELRGDHGGVGRVLCSIDHGLMSSSNEVSWPRAVLGRSHGSSWWALRQYSPVARRSGCRASGRRGLHSGSAVGPLVIVSAVDPADDRLGCLTALESVGEATDLLGMIGQWRRSFRC